MPDVLDAFDSAESSVPDAGVDEAVADLATERMRDPLTGQFVVEDESESEPEAKAKDDDAAPEGEEPEASGEEEAEDGEPETVIDAPASWTDAEREAFAQLPPEMQETISARESERERTINARIANSARETKSTTAERTALQTERQNMAQFYAQVSAYAQQMDPVIQKGLNTDWAALARDEGADEAMAQKAEFDQRVQLLQAVDTEQQRLAKQATDTRRASEEQSLFEKLPSFAEPGSATEAKESYLPTLYDAGYSDEEIDRYWSDMPDHRQAILLDKASKYDRLMADRKALATKKVVKAPRVQKPRAQQEPGTQDKTRIAALDKHLSSERNANDIDALTEFAQRKVGAK